MLEAVVGMEDDDSVWMGSREVASEEPSDPELLVELSVPSEPDSVVLLGWFVMDWAAAAGVPSDSGFTVELSCLVPSDPVIPEL